MKRVCLYLTGNASPEIAGAHGTYERWFGRLLSEHPVALVPFEATTGVFPADVDDFDAIVITGSAASLTAPEPWMEAGVELIRHAYAAQTPLLGVCFGHQLIGAAFGGSVIPNPLGWEVSTRSLEVLDPADPLFDALPARLEANFSHRDIVDPDTISSRNGVRVLASNAKATVQVLAAGPAIRGVQFHPEFDGTISAAHIHKRLELLRADAAERNEPTDDPDVLLGEVRDTPLAEAVFHNFVRHFVLG